MTNNITLIPPKSGVITQIIHISDIHIRNYRYHYEYEQVFEQLYAKLKELKPDIIVNTGPKFSPLVKSLDE